MGCASTKVSVEKNVVEIARNSNTYNFCNGNKITWGEIFNDRQLGNVRYYTFRVGDNTYQFIISCKNEILILDDVEYEIECKIVCDDFIYRGIIELKFKDYQLVGLIKKNGYWKDEKTNKIYCFEKFDNCTIYKDTRTNYGIIQYNDGSKYEGYLQVINNEIVECNE